MLCGKCSVVLARRLRDGLPTVATEEVASGYASTSAGGTLELTPGTYSAATLSITKEISIGCNDGDHGCILDGENDHRLVYVDAGSGTAVSLTGLVIINGSPDEELGSAGVIIFSGIVTMTNCRIADNNALVNNAGVKNELVS